MSCYFCICFLMCEAWLLYHFNQEEGTFSNVKVFISYVPIRISTSRHRHKQVIEFHIPRVGAGCDHCFQSKYGAFWVVNTYCLAPFILELAFRDTFVHIPHHCSFFLVWNLNNHIRKHVFLNYEWGWANTIEYTLILVFYNNLLQTAQQS